MMGCTLRKFILPFCFLGITWAGAAHAAPSNDPLKNIFITGGIDQDHPEEQVNTSIIAGNPPVLYIGGAFTAVRAYTGNGVALDANPSHTGAVDPDFAQVAGDVFAVLPDGAGGWYIVGSFTSVGERSQRNVAHIQSDGTLDTAFNPDPSGLVRTLALSPDSDPDEQLLYIGGDFEGFGDAKVGPQKLAAIHTAGSHKGEYTDWAPNPGGPVESIRALALRSDGNILYAGGDFSALGGQPRTNLAALRTSDGTATDWAPNPDAKVQSLGLSANENVLYVGGNFHN